MAPEKPFKPRNSPGFLNTHREKNYETKQSRSVGRSRTSPATATRIIERSCDSERTKPLNTQQGSKSVSDDEGETMDEAIEEGFDVLDALDIPDDVLSHYDQPSEEDSERPVYIDPGIYKGQLI